MSPKKFQQVVRDVMMSLPAQFEPMLANLVVDVEDDPSPATLRDLGHSVEEIADGASIYGLFIPSTFDDGDGLGGVSEFEQPPHRIIIYQRPLEEDFPDPEQLRTEIRKTVIHELAHHFGWSDRDLESFDDNPNPFE